MSAFTEALDGVTAALAAIEGVSFHKDAHRSVRPPAVALGPPTFTFEGYTSAPVSARVVVALVVAADERAQARLLSLLPAVTEAVHDHTDAVVLTATPGSWTTGGSDLPAYLIEIEAPLT